MSIISQKKKLVQKMIVVAGPTASGKSSLAIALAKKFDGEVISADSRQVYKRLDIGTGKVFRDNSSPNGVFVSEGVVHHCIDVASFKRQFTVAQFQKKANHAIKKIFRKKKTPIICGGTGFYIDAVVNQQSLPGVPPNILLRKKLEKKTITQLYQMLRKKDKRRAQNIDRYNRVRLIRAVEIVLSTGKPVPKQKSAQQKYKTLFIGINHPKEILEKRIHTRLLERLAQGMIMETKTLHATDGLSWKRCDRLGLEYRYIARFLQGLITEDEMAKELFKEICRYAKRQMTWFKRNKTIAWVKNEKEAEQLVEQFLTE